MKHRLHGVQGRGPLVPLKVGIVGSGLVAGLFLEAVQDVQGIGVQALCGRESSRGKAEALAARYGIPELWLDYEAMLGQSGIDLVYVGLPNSLHYDFARRALEAGKQVILEKPFTSNLDQARSLVALAKARGLFLFEAICNQYYPNYHKIRELVPSLGRLRLVQANYSQYSSRYGQFKAGRVLPAFDPAMAGGALMDLGVYNLHFLLGLFGPPSSVAYRANLERGIDTSGILVLGYPDFSCVSLAAKDCAAPGSICLQGEEGWLASAHSTNSLESFELVVRGETQTFTQAPRASRLSYELEAFRDVLARGDLSARDRGLEQSLAVMAVLDEARRQAGIPCLA